MKTKYHVAVKIKGVDFWLGGYIPDINPLNVSKDNSENVFIVLNRVEPTDENNKINLDLVKELKVLEVEPITQ